MTKTHRVRGQTPILQAAALKPWGDWLPWRGRMTAWPETRAAPARWPSNTAIRARRPPGEPATYEDERSNGVEAGLMDMLGRMQTGPWKVFRTQRLVWPIPGFTTAKTGWL